MFFLHLKARNAEEALDECKTLNPKSMQNNSPKPIIIAIKASILPTFGVQVGLI